MKALEKILMAVVDEILDDTDNFSDQDVDHLYTILTNLVAYIESEYGE